MDLHNKQTLPPFARRTDWLILVGVLLGVLALWLLLRPAGASGRTAKVEFGTGAETLEISLENDGIYPIEGGRLPVQLEVEGGRIRFVDSVCPDHTCERQGWLQREGEQAICMPAAVAVTVQE